jgi:multidrug efflux pump
MGLSRFSSIGRSSAAVLSIVILSPGLIAMLAADRRYPESCHPQSWSGDLSERQPRTLAEAVATPLEEQINGVENMLCMQSQGTSDGVLTLTVTFRVGTDVDRRGPGAEPGEPPRLPEEVRQLGVTTVKTRPASSWWCTSSPRQPV